MILRLATPADVPTLEALIEASARGVGPQRYTEAEVESALRYVFGVDTQLIGDGTYYLAEAADGEIIGCGGWSRRKTPFGGDHAAAGVQDHAWRDPAADPAVVRAFFVHPAHVRKGIGRRLLERCEEEARAAGFTRCELVATLTGVPLYAAAGYREAEPIDIRLPDGVVLKAVRMEKTV